MQWYYNEGDIEDKDDEDEPGREGSISNYSQYYVRRIIGPEFEYIQTIRNTYPLRCDIETEHYGRKHLEAFADYNNRISLLFFLFINDFGIHRNMYRVIKGFYIIPACLLFDERRKPANVFTFTLGPYEASFRDVVNNISFGLDTLGLGVELDINSIFTIVKAFSIMLTGDMLQAADCSGFIRHNAAKGCRACFCDRDNRGDLDFDVSGEGRYHFDTVFRR